jgi:hypothetical protein
MKLWYFNDLRHWWIYAYEPPLSPAQVVSPVEEVAGCVDALVLQVDGGSGLWYPSKVGRPFLRNAPASIDADVSTVPSWSAEPSINWRAWQSLAGLARDHVDPLQQMAAHARRRQMEAHASVRMGTVPDSDPTFLVEKGGKGLAEPDMRRYQLAVLTELLTDYDLDGVELDFAAPGGTVWFFPHDEGPRYAPLLTQLLGEVYKVTQQRQHHRQASTARRRRQTVGVHIYPTEEMNRAAGLDVRAWIAAGVIDWVMVR